MNQEIRQLTISEKNDQPIANGRGNSSESTGERSEKETKKYKRLQSNRISARKSRNKRKEYIENLETQVYFYFIIERRAPREIKILFNRIGNSKLQMHC